ncbi:tetratricopeptide repeat protein [Acinetobacter sp. YH16051]|uniref:tetratricopeptide repeat protein n=2 Tax=unclassified Acinetobacter TaxID=196816 RepID=UPI0015D263E7|nr:tetratricopeptide repeat protein [Acinetobacter sp. YH16051]
MISPQTIDKSIFDAMFSNVRKTSSVFKIQSWKRDAEKVRSIDICKYKAILGTIAAYENKHDEAINIFKSILLLTKDCGYQAMIYSNIANVLGHAGKYSEAIDSYWKAFELSNNPSYFESFFNLCKIYYINDQRLTNMKSLDDNKKKFYEQELLSLNETRQEIIENTNLNLDLYRDVLKVAFSVFFTHCNNQVNRFIEVNDSQISTILFNTDLDLETVMLLNEGMNDKFLDLLDSYEYEELIKYPIIFTAENFKSNELG